MIEVLCGVKLGASSLQMMPSYLQRSFVTKLICAGHAPVILSWQYASMTLWDCHDLGICCDWWFRDLPHPRKGPREEEVPRWSF